MEPKEHMQASCCQPSKQNQIVKKGAIDPFIALIVLVSVLVLGIAVYFGVQLGGGNQVNADTAVSLNSEQNSHDWGEIPIDGGVVQASFFIENTSAETLKLYNVLTSCMCTSAQLKTANKLSPRFGMHEKGGSVFTVDPGETAELVVEFDPAFHGPSGLGAISRTVTMQTNDANQPELSFHVTATVVK